MSDKYLDMVRTQQRRAPGFQLTSTLGLKILALLMSAASGIYWWGVQSQLTDNRLMAFSYTLIMVLAPPCMVAFVLPSTPGGMLVQKVNARTIGFGVVCVVAAYLIYYSFTLQYSWWAVQPVVKDSNLIWQQVIIGFIGFIIVPAFLWSPVSSAEVAAQVRQAHLVKRYELQTQADIAILRAIIMRAQEQALKGFANLTPEEREELALVMQGLVAGIQKSLNEIATSVKTVGGVKVPIDELLDDPVIRAALVDIKRSLVRWNPDEDDDMLNRMLTGG